MTVTNEDTVDSIQRSTVSLDINSSILVTWTMFL